MSIYITIILSEKKHSVQLGPKPILLGRSKKCNVKFSDPLLSSKHCEITLKQDGKVIITDLHSTNGSFVNDIKIISSHLYIGDTLKIGEIEISIDTSRLKPSERKLLTRQSEVGRTKFMDLKLNSKTHADIKTDLSNHDETGLETKVVNLEEQRRVIAERKKLLKKKKAKDLEQELEDKSESDVLTKIIKIFKKN